MLRPMLIGKIHRATVTEADLNYVGSITIDSDLLDAADLLPGQQVDIVDVTNGARLTTYVIAGERGRGGIGINGAAAHLVHPGDVIIIIGYGMLTDAEARSRAARSSSSTPTIRIVQLGSDPGDVPLGFGLLPSGSDCPDRAGRSTPPPVSPTLVKVPNL